MSDPISAESKHFNNLEPLDKYLDRIKPFTATNPDAVLNIIGYRQKDLADGTIQSPEKGQSLELNTETIQALTEISSDQELLTHLPCDALSLHGGIDEGWGANSIDGDPICLGRTGKQVYMDSEGKLYAEYYQNIRGASDEARRFPYRIDMQDGQASLVYEGEPKDGTTEAESEIRSMLAEMTPESIRQRASNQIIGIFNEEALHLAGEYHRQITEHSQAASYINTLDLLASDMMRPSKNRGPEGKKSTWQGNNLAQYFIQPQTKQRVLERLQQDVNKFQAEYSTTVNARKITSKSLGDVLNPMYQQVDSSVQQRHFNPDQHIQDIENRYNRFKKWFEEMTGITRLYQPAETPDNPVT